MDTEIAMSLCWDIGECLQTVKFLLETGRPAEAKKFLPILADLRDRAHEGGIAITFFERRSYVRRPHPESPGYKPRAVKIAPAGLWADEHMTYRSHLHITVELILDGTIPGGPQVIPGDIIIEVRALFLDGDPLPWHEEADGHPDSGSGCGRLFGITNITEGT